MVKKIKLPLEMSNGTFVRTLEELQKNWDLGSVVSYYHNGRLETWLKDRYYDDLAQQVMNLHGCIDEHELQKQICQIFDISFMEAESVDVEAIKEKNRKLEQLRRITSEDEVLKNADKAAFNQEDLSDLLDDNESVVYLVNNTFSIPLSKKNMEYIGVGDVTVVINSAEEVDFEEKGIVFSNVRFDAKYQKVSKSSQKVKDAEINNDKKVEREVFDIYRGFRVTDSESYTFSNKKIDLINDIVCTGELFFDNCEILYHKNSDGKIKIAANARLSFKNCIFRCFDCDEENPLFDIAEEKDERNAYPIVYIADSIFYDCTNIIVGNWNTILYRLTIERSNFYNCFNLIDYAHIKTKCLISDCVFKMDKVPDFYKNNPKNEIKELIYIKEGDFVLNESKVYAEQEFVNIKNERKEIGSLFSLLRNERKFFFRGNGSDNTFTVNACCFIGNIECLENVNVISDCIFERSLDSIHSYKEPSIQNCKFNQCAKAITGSSGTKINSCVFDGAIEDSPLIILGEFGGNSGGCIENCLFKNIQVINHNRIFSSFRIGFYFDDESPRRQCIRNCTFENIIHESPDKDFKDNYLIACPYGQGKLKGDLIRLESCEFIACEGPLVNCEREWWESGVFNDREGKSRVVTFDNCTGIDNNGYCNGRG